MSAARRWIGYVALVIVFSTVCALLAWWQFDRRDEARDRAEQIARNWDAPTASLEAVMPVVGEFDAENTWRPVILTGQYLADEQLLVRGRPREGRPGFEVLVPFQTDGGAIVIVNRGWLPVGSDDVPDEIPPPPAGRVEVLVRLKPGEPAIAGRGAPEGQVATIHLPTIAELVGDDVHTGAYGLLDSEEPAPGAAPALPMKPSIDEGPHLSYALQWVVFAIMAFTALGWGVRRERRIRRGLDPDMPRRRRSDADEEDAILDRQG